MEFVYTHAFVTPVFVSQALIDWGVYRLADKHEPRDLHDVARLALRDATPSAPYADFTFGDLTLRGQSGLTAAGGKCIRIGFPEDFEVMRECIALSSLDMNLMVLTPPLPDH